MGSTLHALLEPAGGDPGALAALWTRLILLAMILVIFAVSLCLFLKEAVLRLFWRRPSLSRRAFVTTALAVAAFCLAALYACHLEPDWVKICHYTLPVDRLAPGKTVRIGHLSDFHAEVGSTGRFTRALALLQHEHPDLIVLTGDYLNDGSPASAAILDRFTDGLAAIAPVYAVAGNWDTPEIVSHMTSRGVLFLDEMALDLEVHGVSLRLDGTGCSTALPQGQEGEVRPEVMVLLSHTPRLFEKTPGLDGDLYLCGHTHGGQIRLPFLGTLCPFYNLVGKYQVGQYRRGTMVMIVNAGLGLEGGYGVPRARFCARPEVGIIDIRGKK